MRHVRELYHKAHGFLRNLTNEPIQIGGMFGFILEPSFALDSINGLPDPAWELIDEPLKPGVIYTTDSCSGLYSKAPSLHGIRPGNYWWDGERGYAPVVYVVPDEIPIPEDRRDVIYRWQL
jgi:hypothetical protein